MDKTVSVCNEVFFREVVSMLSRQKTVRIPAKGRSMRPFIQEGRDTIVVSPPGVLRKGDVVLAKMDGGRYVAHRITAIAGDEVEMMGDGNLFGRERCSRDRVVGHVRGTIRDGRWRNLTSPRARLLARAWRCLLPLRRARWRFYGIIKSRKLNNSISI